MDVSVGESWDGMVDTLVRSGRYASATQVVEEGLRLVEAREKKLDWLRTKLQKAIDEGGEVSEDEMDAALGAAAEELRREGY